MDVGFNSTDQIKAIEEKINLSQTLFIVSSKSGSTLEPNILKDYFFEKVKIQLGQEQAAKQFIAITDPGSQLEKTAKEEGFRHIFYGLPSIGGRYSVLSDFGMIPAALMGIDLPRFLETAKMMVTLCSPSTPCLVNPGVQLGIRLGVAANHKKDKVTFVASPVITELGAWLEQLLAESTGKSGKGIIPVDKESFAPVSEYSADRLFVYLRLKSHPNLEQDKKINELETAGFDVYRIELDDLYDLAKEFFRFEFATAVAGSIMGINPFNQPDVEASKIKTKAITSEYEKTGNLKIENPKLLLDGKASSIEIYTNESNWKKIVSAKNNPQSLPDILRPFLSSIRAGDYFALLAYLVMNEGNENILQSMRTSIQRQFKIVTSLGFGPRYLHSTGQVYKGGPNSGIFIEITADDNIDLPVPGKRYTFGIVSTAQAIGDFQVLCERQRRVLRLHLKGELNQGLLEIQKAIDDVCTGRI